MTVGGRSQHFGLQNFVLLSSGDFVRPLQAGQLRVPPGRQWPRRLGARRGRGARVPMVGTHVCIDCSALLPRLAPASPRPVVIVRIRVVSERIISRQAGLHHGHEGVSELVGSFEPPARVDAAQLFADLVHRVAESHHFRLELGNFLVSRLQSLPALLVLRGSNVSREL